MLSKSDDDNELVVASVLFWYAGLLVLVVVVVVVSELLRTNNRLFTSVDVDVNAVTAAADDLLLNVLLVDGDVRDDLSC